jgi:hypothetical protein
MSVVLIDGEVVSGNLAEPVVFNFRQIEAVNRSSPQCVSWNYEKRSEIIVLLKFSFMYFLGLGIGMGLVVSGQVMAANWSVVEPSAVIFMLPASAHISLHSQFSWTKLILRYE